jgi:hypothetical protein
LIQTGWLRLQPWLARQQRRLVWSLVALLLLSLRLALIIKTLAKPTRRLTMQADFFEPQPPASLPEQSARRRVFLYDGQVFEDPGAHCSDPRRLQLRPGRHRP